MACASYTEDLICSICLCLFTDPVSLPCGHSFCRDCVAQFLQIQNLCPHCRTAVATEERLLSINHILKSLAEKAKEADQEEREHDKEKKGVPGRLCPVHDEKLKLFCVTDQQLACVICRDGERHDGHTFKPIKEADVSVRRELERGIEKLRSDVHATEYLAKTQKEEITKTQENVCQRFTQIGTQFEEMYQFLKRKEDEIRNDLQEKERVAVERMSENLKAMELALSESRGMEVRVSSTLDITDAETFLQSWTEGNTMTTTSESPFRSRASEHQVTSASVSLGPYESHLQFFVWKEMLQMIKPIPERFTLETGNNNADPSGFSFGPPQTSQSQTGLSFGLPKTSQSQTGLSFGLPKTSQSQTGLSFGLPKTSQSQTGLSFGLPKTSQSETGLSFGLPKTSQSQTGLSFGLPKTSQSQTGLSFGLPKTSQSQTGLSFGLPKTSQSQTGLSFGLPKTSQSETGLSFGLPKTSQSQTGLSFGLPKTSQSQTGFTFETPKTSQSQTGFSFGLPKTSQSSGFTFETPKTSQSSGFTFETPKTSQSSGFTFETPKT